MRVFSVIVSLLNFLPTFVCYNIDPYAAMSISTWRGHWFHFCHLPASIKCVFVDCRLTVVRYSIDPHVAMPIITVKRSLISFFHLTVEVLCIIMLMTEY